MLLLYLHIIEGEDQYGTVALSNPIHLMNKICLKQYALPPKNTLFVLAVSSCILARQCIHHLYLTQNMYNKG